MDMLDQKIAELELQQAQQLAALKVTAGQLVESISPAQLLRAALRDAGQSPELKARIIDTIAGIGAGFLGRKLYVGRSGNMIKKVTGSALEFLVSNFVRNKMTGIRQNGRHKEN